MVRILSIFCNPFADDLSGAKIFVNNIKGADILFDILLRKILSENFNVVNV